jgi:hypothetical protein
MEEEDLDAAPLHLAPEVGLGLERAQGVGHHADPDAARRRGRGLLQEQAAGPVVLEDVGLEQDLALGGEHRLVHGGERVHAAEEDLGAVAAQDRRAVDAAQEDLEAGVEDALGQRAGEPPDAAGPQLTRQLAAGPGTEERPEAAPAPAGSHGPIVSQKDRARAWR